MAYSFRCTRFEKKKKEMKRKTWAKRHKNSVMELTILNLPVKHNILI